MIAAQQRVLDKYYGGAITSEHDYHSDEEEEGEGSGEEDWEEDGESEGGD